VTAMVTSEITRFIAQNEYGTVSVRLGLFAIVPLIALLIERELLRAFQPDPDHQAGIQWITAVIVPLLAALTLILALRLRELLG
jgi:hypothetical protein